MYSIAENQHPDGIDILKLPVAGQAVRNIQLTTENRCYKTQVLTLAERLNLALAKRYVANSEKISPHHTLIFYEVLPFVVL